jgi:hypothetical protein
MASCAAQVHDAIKGTLNETNGSRNTRCQFLTPVRYRPGDVAENTIDPRPSNHLQTPPFPGRKELQNPADRPRVGRGLQSLGQTVHLDEAADGFAAGPAPAMFPRARVEERSAGDWLPAFNPLLRRARCSDGSFVAA